MMRVLRRYPLCHLACCGVLLWPQAAAQTLPEPSQPVTLHQAASEAVERNLDLLAERFNIAIADAQLITARLRPNPILDLSGDHLDVLGTGYDDINTAGPPEYAARIDFVFERGGKRQRRIEVAQAERSVAELELMNVIRGVIFEVQSAFVDVLLEKANLQLARENLQTLQDIVRVNVERVRTGDVAESELIRSEVAQLQFENEVRQAEMRVMSARLRLRLLLGRQGDDPVPDAVGVLRKDAEPLVLTTLRERARTARPDLLVQQRQQARSRAELRLQLAQGRVDYVIGTEYRRQEGLAGRGNSLGLFFQTNLPVFNRNQGEIARAQTEQSQVDARFRAVMAAVQNDVEIAYVGYETALRSLARIEEAMIARAHDVREITEYSYRRGEATFVEFLDAQRAYNETMQMHNEARADFARSLYGIDAATGTNTDGGTWR